MKKNYDSPEFDITVIQFERILEEEDIDLVSNPEIKPTDQFHEGGF